MTHEKEIKELIEEGCQVLNMDCDGIERQIDALTKSQREAIKAMHEENKRLKERIAELEKADEWQPIETAPKDDREILVASFRVVKNHNDLNEAYLCCDYIVNSYYKKHGQGKAQKNFKEGFYLPWQFGSGVMLVPTHWKPLPTPPEENE